MSTAVRKLGIVAEMIKFEHTVFALPFALISMLAAAGGPPPGPVVGWIVVAMVGARTAAMAFNRIADRRLDAANPRTANRALPVGLASVGTAWTLVLTASAVFVFAASQLNRVAFALSPATLAVILSYSYSKRFTALSHLWLGLCLGIAPVGAWVAVRGEIGLPSLVLSAAVILWTAGFDIIYSLQDVDFDRRSGLASLPARIGPAWSLLVSRLFHAGMVGLTVWFGVLLGLGTAYYCGVGLVAAFLVYEQSLVSPRDITRVGTAFFTMNGFVSVALLVFAAVDVLL